MITILAFLATLGLLFYIYRCRKRLKKRQKCVHLTQSLKNFWNQSDYLVFQTDSDGNLSFVSQLARDTLGLKGHEDLSSEVQSWSEILIEDGEQVELRAVDGLLHPVNRVDFWQDQSYNNLHVFTLARQDEQERGLLQVLDQLFAHQVFYLNDDNIVEYSGSELAQKEYLEKFLASEEFHQEFLVARQDKLIHGLDYQFTIKYPPGTSDSVTVKLFPVRNIRGFSMGTLGLLEKVSSTDILREFQENKVLRLVGESLKDVIWVADSEMKLQYVSPGVKRQRGFSPNEVLGHSFLESIAPEFQESVIQKITEYKENLRKNHSLKKVVEMDLEQPTAWGRNIKIQAHAGVVLDDEGQLEYIVGINREVNRIKSMEDSDASVKNLHKWLFKLSQLRINSQEEVFFEVQSVMKEICDSRFYALACPMESEIGNGSAWRFVSSNLEQVDKKHTFNPTTFDGFNQIVFGGESFRMGFVSLPEVHWEQDSFLLPYFEKGQLQSFVLISNTDESLSVEQVDAIGIVQQTVFTLLQKIKVDRELRKSNAKLKKVLDERDKELSNALKALQESDVWMQNLMDNLPATVIRFRKDADWTIEYISDSFDDASGYPAWFFINNQKMSFLDLIPAGFKGKFSSALDSAISSLSPLSLEFKIMHYDGSEKHVFLRGTPLSLAGDPNYYVDGVLIDMSEYHESQQQQFKAQQRFESIFNQSSDSIAIQDVNSEYFIEVNHTFQNLFEYSETDFKKIRLKDLERKSDHDDSLRIEESGLSVYESELKTKTGQWIPVEIYASAIQYDNQVVILNVIRDIRQRKRIQKELLLSEASLHKAQEVSHLGSWELDLHTEYLKCSPEAAKILGLQKNDKNVLQEYIDSVHPSAQNELVQQLQFAVSNRTSFSLKHQLLLKNGDVRWVFSQGEFNINLDGEEQLIGIIQDITEQQETRLALENKNDELQRALKKVDKMAHADELTGLANRRSGVEWVEYEHQRYLRSGNRYSLALADIDHFKQINDTYGHQCGDMVLKELAQTFKQEVRGQDRIVRWGGEEFLLIFPETALAGAKVAADKVRQKVASQVVEWQGEKINISVTIGVAEIIDQKNIDEVLSLADKALYLGKEQGRNCTRCTNDLQEHK